MPPRKAIPLTILVDATLLALESADVQLLKLPAEQFCISPLLPYTNKYGNSMTAPPETLILLSKVSKTVPEAVAGRLRTTVHTLDTKDAETMVVPA